MCVERERPHAVRRDLRDGAVVGGFQQPLVDRRLRRKAARFTRNDHVLMLAAGAVDDGDGLAARWRGGGGYDHVRRWRLVGWRPVVAGMVGPRARRRSPW